MRDLWRVECENQIGPYVGSFSGGRDWSCRNALGFAHMDEEHPGVHGGACAFASAAELLEWFDGWWMELMREGFRIVVVSVPRGEVSTPESLFDEGRGLRGQLVFTGKHLRRSIAFPDFLVEAHVKGA